MLETTSRGDKGFFYGKNLAQEIAVPNLMIDLESINYTAKCAKERSKFAPITYVMNPYKEEGTRPHIIIGGARQHTKSNPLEVLDVYSKVFGMSDRPYITKPLLMTEEERRSKINLKLKKDNTVKLVTKRIEYNIMTNGSSNINIGDTLIANIGGQVDPWTSIHAHDITDVGRLSFKSNINLKLK